MRDGVPDYLEKIEKPMDLGTIKAKMDKKQYRSAEEFSADVRQIWANCYIYWKPNDALFLAAKKLEKTFEEKYAEMNKWLARMAGLDDEAALALATAA